MNAWTWRASARAALAPAAVMGALALSLLAPPPLLAQAPSAARPAASGKEAAKEGAKSPARAAPKAAATTPAARAAAPGPSGKGWKSGPEPGWIVAAPALPAGLAPAPAVGARRELLFEQQSNYRLPQPQTFIRLRSMALDASALGSVSRPEVNFNPAFQTVVLHGVAVLREGQRSERLAQARIEPMRREQRLEQQIVDGNETLLVVVPDVRLGDAVEIAYTIEGENPIFEGRIATAVTSGFAQPLETLHWRVLAPAGKTLRTRAMAGSPEPQRSTDAAGHTVFTLIRHQVPAVVEEQGTPPWFKTYPAAYLSEYGSWAEVDAWAARLFALPSPAHAAVRERAAAFKAGGKQGAELVAEVLRFVQDEVRYLSMSLGESSHRPKPPQQTLAERLGDCKDKTVLLNALLRELGFEARPALVSMARNRGVGEFLPGHEQFDHVITALELDGRRWLLDSTISHQGGTLAGRGQVPYGRVLVIDGKGELSDAPESDDALNKLEFEQRWDFSRPGQPAQLRTVMRAWGLGAERWRAGAAAGGTERVGQALAGGFARAWPGLQGAGEPKIEDDRTANRFTVTMDFTRADAGSYSRGALEIELAAIELLDALVGPPEPKRRTPWMLDQPRVIDSRVVVSAPQTFRAPSPPLFEVNDRHLRYSSRIVPAANTVAFERRVERRRDEVLPAELDSYRESVLKARGNLSSRLRLALVDLSKAAPEFERIERRLRAARGWRDDQLAQILASSEFGRFIDGRALQAVPAKSRLAAQVLASRAVAHNLVGDFAAGLADADAALAIDAGSDAALDARAVALLGNARGAGAEAALAQALEAFGVHAERHERKAPTLSWMGSIQVMQGRGEPAEKALREALDKAGGDEREFVLIWLYLAAELNGGRGREAIRPHLESVDADKLTGAILRFFDGSLTREALLKRAEEKPAMARLDLAEATFFIGAQQAVRGQREEALRWYRRTLDTGAVPYREHTFAQLELQRGAK